MQTVLLVIHLMIAVALIGSILLQRSEGGALGIGGGGGGGFMSGRGTANALTRLTAMLAAGFFVTCILLTVLARFDHQSRSIIDSIGKPAASVPAPAPAGTTGTATATGGATAPAAPAAPATPTPAATTTPVPASGSDSAKGGLPDLTPILPVDPGTAPKP